MTQHKVLPTCPGQVKIEMGQVNLGIHLPDGASKNISDVLLAISYFGMMFVL